MNDDRWERMAALSGVLVGILFVAIIALAGELPKAPASGTEVTAYFARHHASLLAVAYVEGLAGVVMIWFWGVARSRLAKWEGESARLSNVVLAAGAGQALFYILNGAFVGALAYHATRGVEPVAAEVLYRLGSAAFQVGAFPLGAAWLSAAIVGMRSRALPAWLSWITGVLGLIALILRAIPEETYGPERIGSVAFLIVPLWFVVTGVVLWRRSSPAARTTMAA